MLYPLSQKTILITRSAAQSSRFTDLLKAEGATVLEMPAIEITPPSSWQALDDAIADLDQFDWLILTSTNGVDYVFERLQVLGRLLSPGLKIAVVGRKTADVLVENGRQPDFIPPNFVADALVEEFPNPEQLPGLKILFPRVETGGRDVLVKQLTEKGAIVTEVPAYESACATTMPSAIAAALQSQSIDVVTFASSKTVRCFHKLLTETQPNVEILLQSVCIASIGPQTSKDCRELLGRVDVEAVEYTVDGMVRAIADWAAVG
jgi:uroporphyrinogen-III synthase